MKSISTQELQKRLEAGEHLHLIDVREAMEVAYGIIPGAIHMPLGSLAERFDELNPSTPYIIVCKAGVRSAMACEYLEAAGFEVTNLEGGMLEWGGETIAGRSI